MLDSKIKDPVMNVNIENRENYIFRRHLRTYRRNFELKVPEYEIASLDSRLC